MTIHYKVGGVWTEVQRPYVRRNGVWTAVDAAYVKEAGVWTESFVYDTTPPNSPELTLQRIDNRYIKVGARLPGTQHDTDLKLIKILVGRDKMPSSQYGSGNVARSDLAWLYEPWSTWYYNGANPDMGRHGEDLNHQDSSAYDYKDYPPEARQFTNLPGAQWYYFAAWSQDFEGNWSPGTFSKIWMPKDGVKMSDKIVKEARIQANSAGSLDLDGVNFTEGALIARDSPRSNGVWYHGNKFTDSVGKQGTPSITSAKIRVSRKDDAGQPTANVRLFWHDHQPPDLPLPGAEQYDATVIGTINKGETKWFDIPESFWPKFNTQMKGLGLRFGTGAQDFLEVQGVQTDARSGEVHLVWNESP